MEMIRVTEKQIFNMNNKELENIIELCIGKIFRMGSRSFQKNDLIEYNKCKELALYINNILKIRNQ